PFRRPLGSPLSRPAEPIRPTMLPTVRRCPRSTPPRGRHTPTAADVHPPRLRRRVRWTNPSHGVTRLVLPTPARRRTVRRHSTRRGPARRTRRPHTLPHRDALVRQRPSHPVPVPSSCAHGPTKQRFQANDFVPQTVPAQLDH